NYDALLNGWGSQTLKNNVNFHAGNSTYCAGETARDNMINNFGWNITDGGREPGCPLETDYFITTWETTAVNESITIPTTGTGYNYTVDWGDGNTDSGLTGNATHTYTVPGVYTVKVQGSFPRIYFNNEGDRLKIKSIEQWGTNVWTSMERAFYGCTNLT